MSKLGNFIKEKREEIGLSRRQFVEEMPKDNRIDTSTLGKIETGKIKRPPDKRLEAFARILKVDVKVLRQLLLGIMIAAISLFSPEAKAIEMIKAFEPESGYHLAFSGGKDSVVIKHLAQKAGVKYSPEMALTTIDPPELMQFNRKYHPDLVYHKPQYSMYQLIAHKKHSLPTRLSRFCCQFLKEYVATGQNKIVMQGVRRAESKARSTKEYYMIDDRTEQKGKEYINPILEWSDEYLWKYIHQENIPYCSLYDEGFKRLGCVGCPIASKKHVQKEFERFPRFKTVYLQAIKVARQGINRYGEPYAIKKNFKDEHDVFNWWVSQLSLKDYRAKSCQLCMNV